MFYDSKTYCSAIISDYQFDALEICSDQIVWKDAKYVLKSLIVQYITVIHC